MAWSQDEERMLAQIEQHLVDEDPRLVSRLESFNERVRRSEVRDKGEPAVRRRPRRSTVIIMVKLAADRHPGGHPADPGAAA